MSLMPPAASTSASPSLAQVTPIAAAASCFLAISSVLWPLKCGRHATPWVRQVCAIWAILASSTSKSITSAGVSSMDLVEVMLVLFSHQKIKVAAARRLGDASVIERRITARRRRERNMAAQAFFQLFLAYQKVDLLAGDRQPDAVAVAHRRQGAADRRFRRDMQDHGAEGGAGHARVRNPHHVLHALLRQFPGDGEIAGFRHAGRFRPRILQHQY